jgi:flagellar hook-associated protein 1 FlgK
MTVGFLDGWNRPFIGFDSWDAMGVNTFYRNFISEMAIGGGESLSYMRATTEEILFVDSRRQSIKAVSLEEEMSNMIRFQHAYNASARVINTIDSMIERLVTGLGAGRG